MPEKKIKIIFQRFGALRRGEQVKEKWKRQLEQAAGCPELLASILLDAAQDPGPVADVMAGLGEELLYGGDLHEADEILERALLAAGCGE